MSFEGSIIIKNPYAAQTNNQSSFTFEFTVAMDDETEKLSEQVINWTVSPVLSGTNLTLFPSVWDRLWQSETNNIAYSIMLATGHILTINKDGSRSPIGNILEGFLPVLDLQRRTRSVQYAFEYTNGMGKPQNLDISVIAWDFFGQEPPEESDSVSFIRGRDDIISQIYRRYEEKNKARKPSLFWMQNTRIFLAPPYGARSQLLNITGVYQIDTERQLLEEAHALTELDVSVPFQSENARSRWTLQLNGIFILREKR